MRPGAPRRRHILGPLTFIPGFNSFVAGNRFVQTAIQIGFASVLGPPGAALASGYITAINGGSALDIFKSAIITLATAEAFAGVGSLTDGHFPASNGGLNAANQTPLQWFGSLKHLANVVGHAAIGCASSAAGGGSCQAGALSAGLGAAITPGIPAEFGKVGGLVVTAAVGGTASVVGGGKFANGAVTAAYGYMFNQTAGGIVGGGLLPIIVPGIAQVGSPENEAWSKWVTSTIDRAIGSFASTQNTEAGTATIYQDGTHASIEVSVGGKSLHTEQIVIAGQTSIAIADKVGQPVVTIPLPNAQSALGYSQNMVGRPTGEYNIQTNSCITYCGNVLRAGGLTVPDTTRDLIRYLRSLPGP